ncbi:85/88 kDa calcium-independent phospholipase A2-like isoform X1 [Biomphalaria glabrata]|uniref:phospholipase A2 n=1 Tax=Biomphalaria glabrata TaxID=6526 RepID=A0A9W2ZL07_BIOGL|nr:85/88 kDa calcium-independent phospholipase A2-like isoform X1 [Biomphalaria glabrata]
MAAFLKNLATGFNDIVTAAQAKISPFTVQSATVDKFSQNGCVTTKQDGCLTLYRRTATIPTYECTITKPDMPTKIFSIFRQTVETEAVILYNSLLTMMLPIVNSCTVPCQEDYLQKLLDCIKEHPSWTCAHVAAYLGYHTCLKCPGIVDFIDSQCKTHQMTPLMVALIGKQALAAEELLRLGASLEKKDKNGDTAYHYAVLNCPPLVSLLVDYDHNGVINWLNGKGESALLIACERKLSEATEILIGSKADPRVATADCLPIHAAVRSCDMRSVEIIIQAYPDQANAKDFKYGSTPLHWAENVECIQRLALLGCDLNALNNEGNAPLHVFLATKKKTECLLALLCHGADCNIFDAIGETVLHKAIKNDDLELVRQFVVFGADVNLKTQHGFSPRHLASLSKGKKKDTILFLLHVSGAVRCDKTVKGCLPGCVVEGHYNGQPDQTMAALMKLDNVALFDEQLMATVVHSSRSSDLQGAVLDMTDAPVSMGDRVLCLDGGGIRGLILIQILMEIEAAVGKPIRECFDWIGGTSTGGILALGIARGFSLQYMKGLYVRLKDEVFKGSRPYDSGPFEEMLKREFGEYTLMGDIKHPKILVTAVLADRHPAELYFFRNFEKTLTHPKSSPRNAPEEEKNPWEQKVWEAARSSGAAPTYFRGYGPFLDGGLIANNPTLDVLTEIHEYNMGLSISKRGQEVRPIGCVISLGCGRIPCIDVQSTDVFRPSGPLDAYKAVMGASALGRLVVDQATISEGRVVDRARAWCSMISVPYYRFSPLLSEDVSLDCHDIKILINMLWETHCYMVANKHRLTELASLLRASLR